MPDIPGWSVTTFDAMGTHVRVTVGGPDAEGLADLAEYRLHELEALWSRFLDSSEVSLLNRSAGRPVQVSHDTLELVLTAAEGWRRTDGDFDPTVLTALVAAGYDRSFVDVIRRPVSMAGSLPSPGVGCAGIIVDTRESTVTIPEGVGFDPGGIGKGLAADLVTGELLAEGATGVCLDVGGDIRVVGPPPAGERWRIDIESVGGLGPSCSVELAGGGVATSSPTLRRWHDGQRLRHHLIDPRTGDSSDTDLETVTVVADRAWQADVLTKAVFMRGAEAGLALVDSLGAAARVVGLDGQVRTTGSWVDLAGL